MCLVPALSTAEVIFGALWKFLSITFAMRNRCMIGFLIPFLNFCMILKRREFNTVKAALQSLKSIKPKRTWFTKFFPRMHFINWASHIATLNLLIKNWEVVLDPWSLILSRSKWKFSRYSWSYKKPIRPSNSFQQMFEKPWPERSWLWSILWHFKSGFLGRPLVSFACKFFRKMVSH